MVNIKINLSPAELIAPCGINCRLCKAHIRAKNPCPGCRAPDASKPKTRVICKIKLCERLRASKTGTCLDCSEFPCVLLTHLDKRYSTKYGTSPIKNLAYLGRHGMAKYLRQEEKKWTCPSCGALLCMHEPECFSCGYAWQKRANLA